MRSWVLRWSALAACLLWGGCDSDSPAGNEPGDGGLADGNGGNPASDGGGSKGDVLAACRFSDGACRELFDDGRLETELIAGAVEGFNAACDQPVSACTEGDGLLGTCTWPGSPAGALGARDFRYLVEGAGSDASQFAAAQAECAAAAVGATAGGGVEPIMGTFEPAPDFSRLSSEGSPLTGVVDVVALNDSSCALTADGAVYCWGEHSNGALGLGESGDGSDFSRAQRVAGVDGAQSLSRAHQGSSRSNTCLVDGDGRVACWGSRPGSIVPGGSDATGPLVSPTFVDGVQNAVEVQTGANFTCALQEDGQVTCWWGATEPAATPGLAALGTVQQLGGAGLALLADGSVATYDPYSGSAQVRTQLPGANAVAGDGNWFCVASGPSVRCGNMADPEQRTLELDSNVTALSVDPAGTPAACAVLDDGDTWCWSEEFVGTPETEAARVARNVQRFSGLGVPISFSGVTAWSAGCLVRTDGGLECWSAGTSGPDAGSPVLR